MDQNYIYNIKKTGEGKWQGKKSFFKGISCRNYHLRQHSPAPIEIGNKDR